MTNRTSIGFAPDLAPLILNGSKTLTYRIGDKYDFLEVGNEIDVRDDSSDTIFAKVKITEKGYTTFAELPIDRIGHEKYGSKQEQRQTFEKYYGSVNDNDQILILAFEVISKQILIEFRNAPMSDLYELAVLYSPKNEEQKNNWKKIQEKRINDALENDKKEFIVALLDNQIIGHVFIDYNSIPPHMKALVVKESLRRQGYGTQIIQEVEKRVKEKGFDSVLISVNPDSNKGAKRLYERLGYVQTSKDRYLDYIDPIDGAQDWVIDLEKEI
jgi:ribosomal protein S18 acetylase RimI-like enzyme